MSAAAPRMLRTLDLEVSYAIPRSTVYYWLKTDPTFPKAHKLGPRMVRFKADEVEAWIASKTRPATAA